MAKSIKKTYKEIISDEHDEMIKKNPEILNDPTYKLAGVLDDMSDYLIKIKEEEKRLEPEDPTLNEMLQHAPLRKAAEKIEQYFKQLKNIAIELTKNKNH